MGESYQIAEKTNTKKIAPCLSRNGQLLMPMVRLIERGAMAVDE